MMHEVVVQCILDTIDESNLFFGGLGCSSSFMSHYVLSHSLLSEEIDLARKRRFSSTTSSTTASKEESTISRVTITLGREVVESFCGVFCSHAAFLA